MNTGVAAHTTSSWSLFSTKMSFMMVLLAFLMLVAPFVHPLFNHNDAGAYMGFIAYNLFLATLTANTAKEILVHPFSYTLPSHSETLRRRLLIIAFASNALFILPMLLYPATTLASKAIAIIAVYFAGVAIYLGTIWLTFWLSDTALLGVPIFLAGFAQFSDAPNDALAMNVTDKPLLFIVVTMLLSLPYWQLFERDRLRRLLEAPFIGLVDSMDMAKYKDYRLSVEIARNRLTPLAQPYWYVVLSATLQGLTPQWLYCFKHQLLLNLRRLQFVTRPTVVLQFLAVLVVLLWLQSVGAAGYKIGNLSVLNVMFAVPLLGVIVIDPHNPFLPYSRRGMAYADFLLGLLASLWCLLVGGVIVLVMELFGLLANGVVQQSPTALGLASLFFPFYLTIRLLLSRNAVTVFFTIIVTVVLYAVSFKNYQQAGLATRLVLHVGAWLAYVPALYWYFCRKDLVSNTSS